MIITVQTEKGEKNDLYGNPCFGVYLHFHSRLTFNHVQTHKRNQFADTEMRQDN